MLLLCKYCYAYAYIKNNFIKSCMLYIHVPWGTFHCLKKIIKINKKKYKKII